MGMKYTGQLVTGDLKDNTMTFEIDGEIALQFGRYEITKIEAESQIKNLGIANVRVMPEHRCGNQLTDKELFHDHCLKCGEYISED